jgi:hypothetical protein
VTVRSVRRSPWIATFRLFLEASGCDSGQKTSISTSRGGHGSR